MMAEGDKLYHATLVQTPKLEDVRSLAEEMKLDCTEDELTAFHKTMGSLLGGVARVLKLDDVVTPEVKYPRTPGRKPWSSDNPFNAWAWTCDIQGAAEGKLKGKTLAIKDNIAVAGVPMKNGSRVLEHYMPEFDATVVSRILDEGGRILGKSACEDLCTNDSGINSIDGPVRNPRDETRVPGGSSSGSAALVASGKVDMALGSDQGGSIRTPSSFTGIVGLKPTFGLVPYTGALGMEPTVDHLGPMARNVKDCALLLEVIAGYDDGRDSRQFPNIVVPEYSKLVDEPITGKKVGLLQEGFEACNEEVARIVKTAAQNIGVPLQDVSVPIHKSGYDIWWTSPGLGLYGSLSRNCGVGAYYKGFYPVSTQDAVFKGLSTQAKHLAPESKMCMLYGEYVYRLYGNQFYGVGKNQVRAMTAAFDDALKEVDVLIMPTLPYAAPKIPPAGASPLEVMEVCSGAVVNVSSFNNTGHPAISINAGTTTSGLPVGMMIVGRRFEDLTVLQFARLVEKLNK